MKTLKPILAILFVIAVITVIIILVIKNRKPTPDPLNDPLGIKGTVSGGTTSTGSPIDALNPIVKVKLERYCGEPAKRKYVEDTYQIKCADYGF